MRTLVYQPQIDGLRALAVISVILFHLKITFFNGGYVGVDIFFVISGYLIGSILNNELKEKKLNLKVFFIKRIKRLLPALLVVSLLCWFIALIVLSPYDFISFSKSNLSSIFFLSNFNFWTESNYFDQNSQFKPLLHTWSLGIEMTFYIIFPFFFLFLLNKFKPKKIVFLFILITFLTIVFIEYLSLKGPIFETKILNGILYGKFVKDTIFFLFPFRFFEFLFGVVIIFLPKEKFKPIIKEIFFLIGLLLIFISIIKYNSETLFPSYFALPVMIGTFILIYFRDANYLGRILNNKLSIKIGLISYSLYLVHWPIIVFFKYYNLNSLSIIEKNIIFILSIAISSIIYKFIEKPFRKKYYSKEKIILGFTFLLIISVSIITIFYNGLNFRLDKNQLAIYEKYMNKKNKIFCNPQPSIFKTVRENICVYGIEENADIIILGDSNGTMWFPGFQLIAERNKLNLTSYSRICNNFPHLSYIIVKDKKILKKNFEIFENCQEIKTNAKFLVLGAQWFDYQNVNNLEKTIQNFVKNINKISYNKNFSSIEKIIIMGQIPAFISNMPDINSCFLRPKFFNKNLDCQGYFNSILSKDKYLNKVIELNNFFLFELNKNLDKKFRFLFINPLDILCKKNQCLQIDNNNLIYRDSNHISNYGSELIINSNLNKIETFLDH